MIEAISRAALTLMLAAAKQQLEGGALEIRIPAEVHYRGLLGSRDLSPGMLAAMVLADPAVRRGCRTPRRADQVYAGQAQVVTSA
jgi:hypothetical protein